MVKIRNKAQSVIEYALLFSIVTAAFISLLPLINRSVQGRLRQIQDELSEPVVNEAGEPLYESIYR